jgi:hypothetical protein
LKKGGEISKKILLIGKLSIKRKVSFNSWHKNENSSIKITSQPLINKESPAVWLDFLL